MARKKTTPKISILKQPAKQVVKVKKRAQRVLSKKQAISPHAYTWIRSHLPAIFIGLGMLFMSVSIFHDEARMRALAISREMIRNQSQQHERKSKISSVFIDSLVDTDVEETVIQNGEWSISETIGSHLAESARPGEPGNIIVYGHNTREILGNIRWLRGDEIIHIYTEDGAEHAYAITSIKEVSPNDVQLLLPTTDETLTIYTCSGFLDSQRFIVQAKPVQVAVK